MLFLIMSYFLLTLQGLIYLNLFLEMTVNLRREMLQVNKENLKMTLKSSRWIAN